MANEPINGTTGVSSNASSPSGLDWRPSPDVVDRPYRAEQRFIDNVRALSLVVNRDLTANPLTFAEKETVSLFSGWGGLSQFFSNNTPDGSGPPESSWREILRQNFFPDLQKDDPLLRRTFGGSWATYRMITEGLFEHVFEPAGSMRAETLVLHAMRSLPTSFYTPTPLVSAMWAGVERAGFTGGRILDPGSGSGLFIGLMPETIRRNSMIVAIEKDPLSALVLKALYGDSPNVRILSEGFEETRLPSRYFDLVIGNVPFGDVSVFVPHGKIEGKTLRVHDLFLLKGGDLVKKGGMMSVVVATSFLDSEREKLVREEMIDLKLGLVGASRLSNNVFRQSSTSVLSDVLTFAKDRPGLDYATILSEKDSGYGVPVNAVFSGLDGRERILGDPSVGSDAFGKPALAVRSSDWTSLLPRLSEAFPKGHFDPSASRPAEEPGEGSGIERSREIPGTFVLDASGRVSVVSPEGVARPFSGSETSRAMLADMIPFRETLRALIAMETNKVAIEREIDDLRQELNRTYDSFVDRWGPLTAKSVRKVLRDDPSFPLLLSAENYDPVTNTARKAAIFSTRILYPKAPFPDHVDLSSDALALSLREEGRVDPALMESLTGRSMDEIGKELTGAIYRLPDGSWETSEQYLSGNVVKKLDEAKQAAEIDPSFLENVSALESVQPKPLSPSQITIAVGSSLVDPSDIASFIDEWCEEESKKTGVFYSSRTAFKGFSIQYNREADLWNMVTSTASKDEINRALRRFGTEKKPFLSLLNDAMNGRTPVIKISGDESDDEEVDGSVDLPQTEKARDVISHIQERFSQWVFQDPERAERLSSAYNRRFNVWAPVRYSGAHLTFPGLSSSFKPHEFQKDAVWRIVQGGSTLLSHPVGFGKTATMVMGAMESIRSGTAARAAIVVPNHMLYQATAEAQRLYPGAGNVMAIGKDDLSRDGRRLFAAKVAMGNAKLFIMTHGVFERLALSPEVEIKMTEGFLTEIRREIESTSLKEADEGSVGRRMKDMTVKQLMKKLAKVESRIEKLRKAPKDDLIPFDKMGIDLLLVDEAHYFKNLEIYTKRGNIPGLTGPGSARSFDLFMKARYLMEKNGGEKGLVFATGTPISNMMAELYTMMRYLRPRTLREMGIESFDQWAMQFGQVVTSYELAPEGTGYRKNARFSRYVNLGEMMNFYRQFADIKHKEDAPFVLPEAKVETIAAPLSPFQSKVMKDLALEAALVRDGVFDPSESNILSVITKARKIAVSSKMYHPLAPPDDASKVVRMVERLAEIHHQTSETRRTQMVFCDYGTPGAGRDYNVYDDVKRRLVEKGVSAEEIAYIHDAKNDEEKEALFQRVRDGNVRILIGSTLRMGVGTNVQERLVAIHNLDVPWRPSDLEQRIGRGLRQGNQNETVSIFIYTTTGSTDVFMLETVRRKAEFIRQIEAGDNDVREMSEEDDDLAYQQILSASTDNPLILEKLDLGEKIARLERQKKVLADERLSASRSIGRYREDLEQVEAEIVRMTADLDAKVPDSFSIEIGGKVYENPSDALVALKTIEARWSFGETIGRFGDFDLSLESVSGKRAMVLSRTSSHSLPYTEISPRLFVRMSQIVKDFSIHLKNLEVDKADLERKTAAAQTIVDAVFTGNDELEALRERETEVVRLMDEMAAKKAEEERNKPRGNEVWIPLSPEILAAVSAGLSESRGRAMVLSVNVLMDQDGKLVHELVMGEPGGSPVSVGEMPFGSSGEIRLSDPSLFLSQMKDLGDRLSGGVALTNLTSDRSMVLVCEGGQELLRGIESPGAESSETVSTQQMARGEDLSRAIRAALALLSPAKKGEALVRGVNGGEGFRLLATDGVRMVWSNHPYYFDGAAFSLSGEKALEASQFLAGRTAVPRIEASGSGVRLSLGDESRSLPSDIRPAPDGGKILAKRPDSGVILPAEDFRRALEGLTTPVRLSVENGSLCLAGEKGDILALIPLGGTTGRTHAEGVWFAPERLAELASGMKTASNRLSLAFGETGETLLPFFSSEQEGSETTVLSMPIGSWKSREALFQETKGAELLKKIREEAPAMAASADPERDPENRDLVFS